MAEDRYYPPPEPFQLRRFVPIPQQGDQPPRTTRAGVLAVVLASWPTGYEYQPQQLRPTVPVGTQGDQPPRTSQATFYTLIGSWNPPDPQPTQRTNFRVHHRRPEFSPALLAEQYSLAWLSYGDYQPYQRRVTLPIAQQGDQPPRYTGILEDAIAAVASWNPPDPQPQQRRLSAPIPPAVINQPPPYSIALSAALRNIAWTQAAEYQPFQAPIRAPIPRQGDQPPRQRPAPSWEHWYPPPGLPQLPEHSAAITAPVAVFVPKGRQPEWVLASWQPVETFLRRPPTAPIPSQDQPPRRREWLSGVAASWWPAAVTPQRNSSLVQPGVVVVSDATHFGTYALLDHTGTYVIESPISASYALRTHTGTYAIEEGP